MPISARERLSRGESRKAFLTAAVEEAIETPSGALDRLDLVRGGNGGEITGNVAISVGIYRLTGYSVNILAENAGHVVFQLPLGETPTEKRLTEGFPRGY